MFANKFFDIYKCLDGDTILCGGKNIKQHDTNPAVLSSIMTLLGKVFEAPESKF